jgi:hypothetical protein
MKAITTTLLAFMLAGCEPIPNPGLIDHRVYQEDFKNALQACHGKLNYVLVYDRTWIEFHCNNSMVFKARRFSIDS